MDQKDDINPPEEPRPDDTEQEEDSEEEDESTEKEEGEDEEFPLAPMGVLAPGSAHTRPSAQPQINTSGNFWRTCLQSHLQTSPPAPQK